MCDEDVGRRLQEEMSKISWKLWGYSSDHDAACKVYRSSDGVKFTFKLHAIKEQAGDNKDCSRQAHSQLTCNTTSQDELTSTLAYCVGRQIICKAGWIASKFDGLVWYNCLEALKSDKSGLLLWISLIQVDCTTYLRSTSPFTSEAIL